ncbi:MAG: DNA recombination protein RmuC [Thermoguttaceae bacterium]|nr:DNA recombination protein RmuC [Thermoguttaceae bacterium]
METLVYLGIGALLGGGLTFVVLLFKGRADTVKSEEKLLAAIEKAAETKVWYERLLQQANEGFEKERAELEARKEAEVLKLQEQLAREMQFFEERLEETRVRAEEELRKVQEDAQLRWTQTLKLLKAEVAGLSAEHLESQQKKLQESNQENVDRLLLPLREKIQNFTDAFSRHQTQQAELKTTVEQVVRGLTEQTLLLRKDTEELTRALKADPKKQGNWGEAVLKNILDASGLTEGRDFFIQAHEKDEDGKTLIPDIKIRLPRCAETIGSVSDGENGARGLEEQFLIVDSKVSITHYLAFMMAEDENERESAVRKHVQSVKKHIDELSEKNYAGKLKGTVGCVLMFIPNEGSWLLAMEREPGLLVEAYRKRVLLVNPATLMLALNTIRLIWQGHQQAENVRKIIDSATRIYEKFAGISENFVRLGTALDSARDVYSHTQKQFVAGRGNLVRQFENWKELGIQSTKQLHPRLLEEAQNGAGSETD